MVRVAPLTLAEKPPLPNQTDLDRSDIIAGVTDDVLTDRVAALGWT